MSRFVTEVVTSAFAGSDSRIGEAVSDPFNPLLYPVAFAAFVVQKEATGTIVPQCSRARDESSDDEDESVDVLEGVPSGAESEGFLFVDALKSANLMVAFDLQTVTDTFGMPTCVYCFDKNL